MAECPLKDCDCLSCDSKRTCPLRKILTKLEEIEQQINVIKRRIP